VTEPIFHMIGGALVEIDLVARRSGGNVHHA
jgi:hypothetical protein